MTKLSNLNDKAKVAPVTYYRNAAGDIVKKQSVVINVDTLETRSLPLRMKQGDTSVHEIDVQFIDRSSNDPSPNPTFNWDAATVYYSVGGFQIIEDLTFILKNSVLSRVGNHSFEIEFKQGDKIRRTGRIEYTVEPSIDADVEAYDKYDELDKILKDNMEITIAENERVQNEQRRQDLFNRMTDLKTELDRINIDELMNIESSEASRVESEAERQTLYNEVLVLQDDLNVLESVLRGLKTDIDDNLALVDVKLNEVESKMLELTNLIDEVQAKLDRGDFIGETGKSAYEVWLEDGNTGTIKDYLADIKGDPFRYEDFTPEQLEALKGEKGDTGEIENFTSSHIENALGFIPKDYIGGDNISVVDDTISVTGQLGLTEDEVKLVKVDKAIDADTTNGYKVFKEVPSDAKFTDTTYGVASTTSNGLMSNSDKSKLDDIEANADVTPNDLSSHTITRSTGASSWSSTTNPRRLDWWIGDFHTRTTELRRDKVDKVSGKGLSDNNFSDFEKIKLDGIDDGANLVESASLHEIMERVGYDTYVAPGDLNLVMNKTAEFGTVREGMVESGWGTGVKDESRIFLTKTKDGLIILNFRISVGDRFVNNSKIGTLPIGYRPHTDAFEISFFNNFNTNYLWYNMDTMSVELGLTTIRILKNGNVFINLENIATDRDNRLDTNIAIASGLVAYKEMVV